MKKISAVFALLMVCGTLAMAQSVTPIKGGAEYIASTYPAAANVVWVNATKAQLTHDNHTLMVNFNQEGQVVSTSTQVLWAEVPPMVMKGHKTSDFKYFAPVKNYKVEKGGVVTYLLVCENPAAEKVYLSFAESGDLIGEVDESGN